MKILVVSDTHGREENLEKLLADTPMPDCMIHLGDSEGGEDRIRERMRCPVYMVAGNCDYFTSLPNSAVLTLCDHKILITHGHNYYVGLTTSELAAEAKKRNCDMALFGHTHRPLQKEENGVIIANPGSLSFPRQEGRRPGYLLITLEEDQKPVLEQCFL